MKLELNSNAMGEFFERLGQRTVRSESSWWHEVQPGVLLSFPYHRLIQPSEDEVKELFEKHKLRAVRYPTPLSSFGFPSTVAINTDRDYDLHCQYRKARNHTRRGIKSCVVKQIDFSYLIENGIPLNKDTSERQGRHSQYAEADYWSKYCTAAQATSGVSAWGAFVDGELAAFLVAIEVDEWVEWVVNHSITAFRKQSPNNALVLFAAQHFFKKGCKGICYGLGSLEPTPDLDHFKRRMGWTFLPIKQRLVFSRKIHCASWLIREPFLKLLGKTFPKSYKVRKASAMIRLYRQQTDGTAVSDTDIDS